LAATLLVHGCAIDDLIALLFNSLGPNLVLDCSPPTFDVAIGSAVTLTNPCEPEEGHPFLGSFNPGDAFTLNDPPPGVWLSSTVSLGQAPSFTLHVDAPVDGDVFFTYSNHLGEAGKGAFSVHTLTLSASARIDSPDPDPLPRPNPLGQPVHLL